MAARRDQRPERARRINQLARPACYSTSDEWVQERGRMGGGWGAGALLLRGRRRRCLVLVSIDDRRRWNQVLRCSCGDSDSDSDLREGDADAEECAMPMRLWDDHLPLCLHLFGVSWEISRDANEAGRLFLSCPTLFKETKFTLINKIKINKTYFFHPKL